MRVDTSFVAENALIARKVRKRGPLVMAHRATSGGSVPENTTLAVQAALRSGADAVEIDVTGSTDGVFYVHHDGMEGHHLSTTTNLTQLPAAEIDDLSYPWHDQPGNPVRLERLTQLLSPFRGSDALFQVDRSWPWWPEVLDTLAALDMTDQLVVKCWAGDPAVEALASHPARFAFVAMHATLADVERLAARDDLNLVGVEVAFTTLDAEMARPETLRRVHELGLMAWVNTLVLPNGVPMAAEYDDELALTEGPAAAWGPLLDLGFDAIQTDWPWLLAPYRDAWVSRR